MGQGGARWLTGADDWCAAAPDATASDEARRCWPVLFVCQEGRYACRMKTIEIPDDLYWKVWTKSALQRRRISAVAADLLQQWADEEEPVTPERAVALARLETLEKVFRQADELMREAPPGPTIREILEQDRSRLD